MFCINQDINSWKRFSIGYPESPGSHFSVGLAEVCVLDDMFVESTLTYFESICMMYMFYIGFSLGTNTWSLIS